MDEQVNEMPFYPMSMGMPGPLPQDQLQTNMALQQQLSNIVSQINPETLLTDMEWRIRGYKKNYSTQQWEPIVKGQKPVSDLLVKNVISYTSPLLTNNVTLSNYTDDEINRLMKLIITHLIQDMKQNAKNYGLENDYAERNRIMQIVCTSAFSSLKRGLKGNESSKFWKSLTLSGDTGNDMPQQKKSWRDYLKII
jgi:hypothetical protein